MEANVDNLNCVNRLICPWTLNFTNEKPRFATNSDISNYEFCLIKYSKFELSYILALNQQVAKI